MAFPQVMHIPTNVPYATLGKWSNRPGAALDGKLRLEQMEYDAPIAHEVYNFVRPIEPGETACLVES